ncbi:hypothetical protein L2E82_42964 [Cichorium intybus]|uniref:Uncharacterized protein n=1 Tax=Cichorium intybus TaxID=13427 RepID=A0ACB8ZM07_CICIN|nr:hypothetical protein L2E82_42964 [Cichorium intybus]
MAPLYVYTPTTNDIKAGYTMPSLIFIHSTNVSAVYDIPSKFDGHGLEIIMKFLNCTIYSSLCQIIHPLFLEMLFQCFGIPAPMITLQGEYGAAHVMQNFHPEEPSDTEAEGSMQTSSTNSPKDTTTESSSLDESQETSSDDVSSSQAAELDLSSIRVNPHLPVNTQYAFYLHCLSSKFIHSNPPSPPADVRHTLTKHIPNPFVPDPAASLQQLHQSLQTLIGYAYIRFTHLETVETDFVVIKKAILSSHSTSTPAPPPSQSSDDLQPLSMIRSKKDIAESSVASRPLKS